MKSVLTLLINTLAVCQLVRGDCEPPNYEHYLEHNCNKNNYLYKLPNYLDTTQYWSCTDIGKPVLLTCEPSTSLFSFILQNCTTCNKYIPAKPCHNINLPNVPNCIPINYSETTPEESTAIASTTTISGTNTTSTASTTTISDINATTTASTTTIWDTNVTTSTALPITCQLPNYSEYLEHNCVESNYQYKMPNYLNNSQYWSCTSIGNPVLLTCESNTPVFTYVLQSCTSCIDYIPAVPCNEIKLPNSPSCLPTNSSESTPEQSTSTANANPSTTTISDTNSPSTESASASTTPASNSSSASTEPASASTTPASNSSSESTEPSSSSTTSPSNSSSTSTEPLSPSTTPASNSSSGSTEPAYASTTPASNSSSGSTEPGSSSTTPASNSSSASTESTSSSTAPASNSSSVSTEPASASTTPASNSSSGSTEPGSSSTTPASNSSSTSTEPGSSSTAQAITSVTRKQVWWWW